MITAIHTGRDLNWNNASTTYWFMLTGDDVGTGTEFNNDTFGCVESGGDQSFVYSTGEPMHTGRTLTAVMQTILPMMTEALRNDI